MNALLRNNIQHLLQMVIVFLMIGLLLLGSVAPYGQDDPHKVPTPTTIITGNHE